ncbi:PREDICTED: gastrin-releasing peptide [Pygoscelis adeliae]|uniref:gastrin-releasing peptide n=1 Tax=Pygoscelis adeliae TaxID=9238 RepID=UPI0004F50245|nr:PREDICTED: gastrin-releasing peptide [Pygoscelis adeliae]
MWKSGAAYPNPLGTDEFLVEKLPVILTEDEEGPKNVLMDVLIPKAVQAFHRAEESPSYILQIRHLMGKKSTGDFPYVYEENKTPFSAVPENIKQLEDYLQWEEISKYLLRLLEGNENKSAHFLKGELPWHTRNTWETDDNSSWKDMMDYLLQVVNMKESTPS